MNKIVSVLIFMMTLIGSLKTQAQFKQLAEGAVFEEPEDGFAKHSILLLHNFKETYNNETK